uniref:Uncharacterized protein n=1 Tax=Tetranychus urticae TaxID=32264 RepID=T1KTT9_TETUR
MTLDTFIELIMESDDLGELNIGSLLSLIIPRKFNEPKTTLLQMQTFTFFVCFHWILDKLWNQGNIFR